MNYLPLLVDYSLEARGILIKVDIVISKFYVKLLLSEISLSRKLKGLFNNHQDTK